MVAPTTQIETLTIVRPLKVMAFVCGCFSLLLLIIAIASTSWLEASGYKQGLWEECSWENEDDYECRKNEQQAWIIACAALSVIGMLIDLVATVLAGTGLITKDTRRKFTFYRVAMYLMFLAIVCLIVALIVFPSMFMQEIYARADKFKTREWYFAWAYGVAWGAVIFLLGAAILLLIDKESEEIFYREKIYYDHGETNA